jgi:predicted enzyme related to lactoylglutathione lyase
MPTVTEVAIVFDCREPLPLAKFWQGLVGGSIDESTSSPDWVEVKGIAGLGYLGFQRVPESKKVKNRVHIDLTVDDIAASTNAAIQRGANAIGAVVEESTNWFQVMADPEGNEFCFVRLRQN